MVCYSPKFAKYTYYNKINDKTGEVYKSKSLKFLSPTEIDILTPFKDGITAIPCGKCVGCRVDKANDWATRASIEATQYKKNCFLTLTYDNEHLPEGGKLQKEDLQKFWKRLRKHIQPERIRYICCGEYGLRTKRPHYHAIIFNFYPEDAKTWGKNHEKDDLKTSKTIENLWGKGFVVVAPANYETAAYVARYCVKKAYGKKLSEPKGKPKEFILASKMPAIGSNANTNPELWQKIKRNNGIPMKINGKVVIKKIPSINRKIWREKYDREEYYNWTEERARAQKEDARARDTDDNYFKYSKKQIETISKTLKILDNHRKTM